MDDLQKVMKGLECCSSGNSCQGKCPYDEMGYEWTDCVRPLARDALALLKAKEQKLVANITKEKKIMLSGYCPACGEFICCMENEKTKYCESCGQAVKWDE